MRILLADHHVLFREGMRYILGELDVQVDILEVSNFPNAFHAARDYPYLELALLDLDMPGSEGVPSIKLFHENYPDILVVVVSGSDLRDNIEWAINSGARGFISKMSTGQDMIHALRLVLDGGIYLPPQLLQQTSGQVQKDKRSWRINKFGLTARQMEVLQRMAAGLSNRDIGLVLGLAEGTIKAHVASILHALHVNKRMDAVKTMKRKGMHVEGIKLHRRAHEAS